MGKAGQGTRLPPKQNTQWNTSGGPAWTSLGQAKVLQLVDNTNLRCFDFTEKIQRKSPIEGDWIRL